MRIRAASLERREVLSTARSQLESQRYSPAIHTIEAPPQRHERLRRERREVLDAAKRQLEGQMSSLAGGVRHVQPSGAAHAGFDWELQAEPAQWWYLNAARTQAAQERGFAGGADGASAAHALDGASDQESDQVTRPPSLDGDSVWVNRAQAWHPREELHTSLMALHQFFIDSSGSLEQAFREMDTNNSGEVVLCEWNERLGNLGFVERRQADEKKASRALFKLLACHGQGDDYSITRKELLALDKLDSRCSDQAWQDLLYGDRWSCPEEILRLRHEVAKERASHSNRASLGDVQVLRSFEKTHRLSRANTTPLTHT